MMDHGILPFLLIALQPVNVFVCFIGAVIGTLVGVLPGLGPAAAMALVLPLTLKLGPTAGLIMLAGIYYGSMYGGSTTSILVNVPGEPASVVTTLDGYAMARKGRAGAALAIAAIGSFVAGTFSVIALQLFAPLLARSALAFGPAEYFALAALGIVLLSNLTGKSRIKSLVMMMVGLMLSTIGMDPIGGIERFSFGIVSAQGGVSFIAITAGLFGVAEVLSFMAEKEKEFDLTPVRFRELYPNREEIKRSVAPMARGSVLGFLIGLLPGPAATIASFSSYGLERRISKRKEEFGRGAIEGVAGPESANNAAAGGAMIPLLSLGLPFTPTTAVLLGGMLLHGITPGPFLMRDRPDVFWGVIGSFYLGNAMLLILNLPLVGIFARIVRIAPKYLMPTVLVLCVIGAYGDNSNLFDVWVMLGAGVVGYLMRKYDYEPAPLMVGLVLGTVMERSLRQTLIISRGDISGLWESPISAIILLIALVAAIAPSLIRYLRVKLRIGSERSLP
ncbi:MAG: tripartite tricarboxylate transporter permease [Thermodesulfobacteriota bacterium]|nr:tripartite tricarboxylate transporter permease [Thermodesulfobacteriota bacterium]